MLGNPVAVVGELRARDNDGHRAQDKEDPGMASPVDVGPVTRQSLTRTEGFFDDLTLP